MIMGKTDKKALPVSDALIDEFYNVRGMTEWKHLKAMLLWPVAMPILQMKKPHC